MAEEKLKFDCKERVAFEMAQIIWNREKNPEDKYLH